MYVYIYIIILNKHETSRYFLNLSPTLARKCLDSICCFLGGAPIPSLYPSSCRTSQKNFPKVIGKPCNSALDRIKYAESSWNICHHQKQTQDHVFAHFFCFFGGSTQATKIHHTSTASSKMVQQRCAILVPHSLSHETLTWIIIIWTSDMKLAITKLHKIKTGTMYTTMNAPWHFMCQPAEVPKSL